LKVDMGPDEIEEFDPFSGALAFRGGSARVRVSEAFPEVPAVRLGDEVYGPFSPGEELELPLQAAVFLMCKGVAELA
ncbi:hypothetical protein DRO32_03145, partial [Candidatus Bathyarchaeota archaeon]